MSTPPVYFKSFHVQKCDLELFNEFLEQNCHRTKIRGNAKIAVLLNDIRRYKVKMDSEVKGHSRKGFK